MTMRRAVLALALVVGLLGMHGLATGHMTMPATTGMPAPGAAITHEHAPPAHPTSGDAHPRMNHDVCQAVLRDTSGVHLALPAAAGHLVGTRQVSDADGTIARTGRAPPPVSLDRLCISRT